ncbi:unnamed protein product [Orchesella dallaii]|uniref:Uncharacterized protein n=1 Tax=Orchesella dallaii TaxID=48710 RepID=A0ABP1PLJ0_9HEXA
MYIIRKNVAKYIEQRYGGIPSISDDIILSAGASEGIRVLYYLETHVDGWDVNVQELETIVENARKNGNCDPRGVVI